MNLDMYISTYYNVFMVCSARDSVSVMCRLQSVSLHAAAAGGHREVAATQGVAQ